MKNLDQVKITDQEAPNNQFSPERNSATTPEQMQMMIERSIRMEQGARRQQLGKPMQGVHYKINERAPQDSL